MSTTIGSHVDVSFPLLGNKQMRGKVDTGATISSLHAVNIEINPSSRSVSFSCPELSDNRITIPIDSSHDVRSADGGTNRRPVVRLTIDIDGVTLQDMEFNLNDRSDMDDHLLIGHNILSAADFVVDVKEGIDPVNNPDVPSTQYTDNTQPSQDVLAAIRVLMSANITVAQLIQYASVDSE